MKKLEQFNGIPVLPLRDIVVFPYMVVPLFVGRDRSIKALECAANSDKRIVLCTQKNSKVDQPEKEDIYSVGVVSEILQFLKMPDGSVKVLMEGLSRIKILEYSNNNNFFQATGEEIKIGMEKTADIEALMRNCIDQFGEYVKLNRKLPSEIVNSISNIEEPDKLVDVVSAHIILKIEDKQKILEMKNAGEALQSISTFLESEIEILNIEKKIRGQIKNRIEKTQREYYLTEQMKAIQKELGQEDERLIEVEELQEKILAANMPKDVNEKALKELKRLEKMPPMAAESTVIRNYLDWLVSLPWAVETEDKLEISEAEKILNEDHYGLEKPKERILEFLAVRKLADKMKGPILCFVGPPGVGKTSLARSIARSMGREFVRISLGGVRDEAEIRGHRRTYIGAMPGRIIQCLKRAKARNPVFLLDEIDKMSMDFRGDPSSAMLEVLDPEVNSAFNDHYLEVDFDLSKVMFITTANVIPSIPIPLRDRMEVIEIPGYTEEEKIKIARKFIFPKQLMLHGLKDENLALENDVLRLIIRYHTREAGVRNLERELAAICRKVAKDVVSGDVEKQVKVNAKNLDKFLGPLKFLHMEKEKKDEVGVSTGLAWTEVGGEILTTETAVMKGKGKLTLTGKLGDVMQESAQAALSYIRSCAKDLHIDDKIFQKVDIHVHVPEGAIPKDGPSAGITIAVSIASALSNKPVRKDVAMTGEITLRGKVLPIGGLKEKILAAHRVGIKEVIVPEQNSKDLIDIPKNVLNDLKINLVESMEKVFLIVFKINT
ncbi:MAG: endopeptidase La [bacterium]